jgi:hypothetical protein
MQEPKNESEFAIQFKLDFPNGISAYEVGKIRNLNGDADYKGYKFSSGPHPSLIYGKNQNNIGIIILDSFVPGEIAKYINDQIVKKLPESEKNGMIMRGDDDRGGQKSRPQKIKKSTPHSSQENTQYKVNYFI